MTTSQTQIVPSGQKPAMSLTDARAFLEGCLRHELVDHAFGDAEVGWQNAAGEQVASAYFGNSSNSLGINETEQFVASEFSGEDARSLQHAGTLAKRDRNDDPASEIDRGSSYDYDDGDIEGRGFDLYD